MEWPGLARDGRVCDGHSPFINVLAQSLPPRISNNFYKL